MTNSINGFTRLQYAKDGEEWRRPYRIQVFASKFAPVRDRMRPHPHTVIELKHIGFDGWNPIQSYSEARLSGAGSFLYPGLIATRKAAMEFLAAPGVHQVSIRTNQDKKVYRYFKHEDGSISGYGGE